jgi:agarase
MFVTKAIKTPFIIGCHWFKWHDNPKEGVPKKGRLHGENSNYGIVNITDKPYQPLVDAMIETHENMYRNRTSKEKLFPILKHIRTTMMHFYARHLTPLWRLT